MDAKNATEAVDKAENVQSSNKIQFSTAKIKEKMHRFASAERDYQGLTMWLFSCSSNISIFILQG